MCTDCNEITIPVGPTGAAGTNGTNGVKGDTGLTGANGQNGTSILKNTISSSGTGNPAPINSTTTLFTYTAPANTLLTIGDEIEFDILGDYDNPNTITLFLKLNGASIYNFNIVDTLGRRIVLKYKISMISTSSILLTINYRGDDNLNTNTSNITFSDFTVVALTTTNSNVFNFDILNLSAGANQFVLYKATAYKYSA